MFLLLVITQISSIILYLVLINTEEYWDPLLGFKRMNDNGELPEMYKSTVSQIHNFFRFLDPRDFGLLIFAYVLP